MLLKKKIKKKRKKKKAMWNLKKRVQMNLEVESQM